MSVVIRGMKMPNNCDECDLNYDCFRCILPIENSLLYGKDTTNGRLPNCPLVELPAEHGRLIDSSAIGLTDFEIVMCDGNYKEALTMLLKKIERAPTVVEAEEVSE